MDRVAVTVPSEPVSVPLGVRMPLLSGTTWIGTPATTLRLASTAVMVTVAVSEPVFFSADLSVVITSAVALGVSGVVLVLVAAPPLHPAINAASTGNAIHENFILLAPTMFMFIS